VSIFALDSNIVSFYIRQNSQVIKKVQDELALGNEVLITPIAYYEVKRGLLAINAQNRLNRFYALCGLLGVGRLDNTILDIAAEIYVELRRMGHDFTLVTNNTNHFEVISDLHFCDWA
jgi:predicted nucleic acid-binding protein